MSRHRGNRALIAILAALALILAACGDDSGSSSSGGDDKESGFESGRIGEDEAGDDEEIVTGGVLDIAVFVEVTGLDPIVPTGNGCCGLNELAAIYDTLMRYDPDSGEFEPHLAESLESNDDLTEWTLKLRPDVTFTDGTPLDAEAVVYNLQRHAEGRFASLVGLVESYDTPDDLTVVMTTVAPWAGVPFMLTTMPGLIGSKEALEADAEGFNTAPVGAGPFKLKNWNPGEELVLERNPSYWGGDVPLDGLRFVLLPDPISSLKAGDIDMSFVRTAVNAHEAEAAGMNGYVNHQNSGQVILINNCGIPETCKSDPEDMPTSDVRVREALIRAVDPAVVDRQLSEGRAGLSYDLFSETSRWHTESTWEPDPDRARELLDEYKAETGWDGKLRFKTTEPLGVAIKAQADAVGFDIEIVVEDVAGLIKAQSELDYEILGSSWNLDDSYPYMNLANRLESSRPTNTISYANEKVDDLITQLRGASSDEEVQDILDELQVQVDETFPTLVLGAVPEGNMWSPKVHGIVPTSTSGLLFHEAWKES